MRITLAVHDDAWFKSVVESIQFKGEWYKSEVDFNRFVELIPIRTSALKTISPQMGYLCIVYLSFKDLFILVFNSSMLDCDHHVPFLRETRTGQCKQFWFTLLSPYLNLLAVLCLQRSELFSGENWLVGTSSSWVFSPEPGHNFPCMAALLRKSPLLSKGSCQHGPLRTILHQPQSFQDSFSRLGLISPFLLSHGLPV